MKDRQFHIYLDDEEYGQVLQALIALKNNLIAQGRYPVMGGYAHRRLVYHSNVIPAHNDGVREIF